MHILFHSCERVTALKKLWKKKSPVLYLMDSKIALTVTYLLSFHFFSVSPVVDEGIVIPFFISLFSF